MNSPHSTQYIVFQRYAKARGDALHKNKLLLVLHKVMFTIILFVILHMVIHDPSYVEIYKTSTLTFVISMVAWLFSVSLLSCVAMLIPAALFSEYVSPEILTIGKHLSYLGGSVALSYSNYIVLFPFFKYLLGYETSIIIDRNQIRHIGIEKAQFLKPAFGIGTQIVIKYDSGEIRTGLWLRENEKMQIIDSLIRWKESTAS